jgi:hypothetical protein
VKETCKRLRYLLPDTVHQIFVGLCNTLKTTTSMLALFHLIYLCSWYNLLSINITNSNSVLAVNILHSYKVNNIISGCIVSSQ